MSFDDLFGESIHRIENVLEEREPAAEEINDSTDYVEPPTPRRGWKTGRGTWHTKSWDTGH